jgi:pimeloyl-ACP methyl ester carboxylesterase
MKQTFIIVVFAVVSLLYSATSQSALGEITLHHQDPLPVILIHGYFENATVWNPWVKLLKHDGVPTNWIFPVKFQSSGPCSGIVVAGVTLNCDPCGSATQHAQELVQIVQQVKMKTGADKVNIVGHSKGGLDARMYLGNNPSNSDVANLIMIGTPNHGSELAGPQSDPADPCIPAVYDIRVGASDTMAPRNDNTQYYTIAGDWNPFLPCNYTDFGGYNFYFYNYPLDYHNDGLVRVSSVESQPYFNHLVPHSPSCHQDLMGELEYNLARDVLHGGTTGANSNQSIPNIMTGTEPNIAGSLSVRNMMAKSIGVQIHVSLANASTIAEKFVGTNAHAVSARLGEVRGFLAYIALISDTNHGMHNVVVDAGNGKVLNSTRLSIATMMVRHGFQ